MGGGGAVIQGIYAGMILFAYYILHKKVVGPTDYVNYRGFIKGPRTVISFLAI